MIVPPRQIRVHNGIVYTAGSECPDDPVVVDIKIVEVAVEEVAPELPQEPQAEVEVPTDSHTEEAVKPKFNKKNKFN